MGINYGDFFEFSGECSRTAQRGLRGGRVSAHNTQREASDARQVGNHAQPIAKLRSLAPSPCSAGRLPPGLREVLRGGKAAPPPSRLESAFSGACMHCCGYVKHLVIAC